VAFVNIYKFVDLGSIQYRGGAVEFLLTFEVNYIIIRIQLCRCVERKSELVAHVWSQLVLLEARMTYP
jgi:hypothetical protein